MGWGNAVHGLEMTGMALPLVELVFLPPHPFFVGDWNSPAPPYDPAHLSFLILESAKDSKGHWHCNPLICGETESLCWLHGWVLATESVDSIEVLVCPAGGTQMCESFHANNASASLRIMWPKWEKPHLPGGGRDLWRLYCGKQLGWFSCWVWDWRIEAVSALWGSRTGRRLGWGGGRVFQVLVHCDGPNLEVRMSADTSLRERRNCTHLATVVCKPSSSTTNWNSFSKWYHSAQVSYWLSGLREECQRRCMILSLRCLPWPVYMFLWWCLAKQRGKRHHSSDPSSMEPLQHCSWCWGQTQVLV